MGTEEDILKNGDDKEKENLQDRLKHQIKVEP